MKPANSIHLRFRLITVLGLVSLLCLALVVVREILLRPTIELNASGNVMVSAADIECYEWETHTMFLKPGVYERFLAEFRAILKKTDNPWAAKFEMNVNGIAIYGGQITSGHGLSYGPTVYIDPSRADVRPDDSHRCIQVQHKYHVVRDGVLVSDPRDDEGLKKALNDLGLLKKTTIQTGGDKQRRKKEKVTQPTIPVGSST